MIVTLNAGTIKIGDVNITKVMSGSVQIWPSGGSETFFLQDSNNDILVDSNNDNLIHS